jgi:hypothetical protein
MKHLPLAICLLLSVFGAQAQSVSLPLPIDKSTQKVCYTGTVRVAKASQSELYARARQWLLTEFKVANAVLLREDQPAGTLVGQGSTVFSQAALLAATPRLSFTLSLAVKKGSYQYTLTDIANEDTDTTPGQLAIRVEAVLRNTKAMMALDPTSEDLPDRLEYLNALHAEMLAVVQRLEAIMATSTK